MYQKKYTPEEKLQRIKLFMKYDSNKTLSEQVAGVTSNKIGSQQNPVQKQTSELSKIADEFYVAAQGAGTNEKNLVAAVKKIKTAKDFWNVNSYLKTKPKRFDFVQTINDEFEPDNYAEAKEIRDYLNSIGVKAEFREYDANDGTKRFGENSFKIVSTATPASDVKTKTKTQKRAAVKIPAELKNADGLKKFQDWLDQNKAGWATGYQGGVVNKGKGYGSFGPRTQKAWTTYKNEYLKASTLQQPAQQPAQQLTRPTGEEELQQDNLAPTDKPFK